MGRAVSEASARAKGKGAAVAPGPGAGPSAGAVRPLTVARGKTPADRVARAAADRLALLVSTNGGPPTAVFATGSAGVRWALRRYAEVAGDRSFAEVGSTGDLSTVDGVGWSRGRAGLLAGAAASRSPHEDLDRYRRELRTTDGCRGELSLDTGLLGVLDALQTAAAAGYLPAVADLRRASACLDIGRRDPVLHCGTPGSVRTPGLLVGLAGIGFGLLRLARPEEVPSPLFLDPAR